jgi:co-chaperonin GroES (HSP10)
MVKTIMEPAGDQVIVLEVPRANTLDGFVLPDNEREQEMHYGRVIFVGPQCSKFTQPQDSVAFGPYAGKHLLFDGVQFRIMKEGQIEVYFRNVEHRTLAEVTEQLKEV